MQFDGQWLKMFGRKAVSIVYLAGDLSQLPCQSCKNIKWNSVCSYLRSKWYFMHMGNMSNEPLIYKALSIFISVLELL